MVTFEWDEKKNEFNIGKHGIGFKTALGIFDGPTLDHADERHAYGEVRVISIGEIKNVVVATVVHTDRDGIKRIISARTANRKERRLYEVYQRALTGGTGEAEG